MRVPPLLFIDANIFISDGRPPGGDVVRAIKNLVRSEKLRVVTTDLTIQEVTKRFAKQDEEQILNLSKPHVRQLVKEILGVEISEIDAQDLRARIWSEREKSVRALLGELAAETVSVDEVRPSGIFTAYAMGTGIFDGRAKRDQFPDAFIFEAIRVKASDETHLFVLSGDKDFAGVTGATETITHVRSIGELLQLLDLEVSEEGIEKLIQTEEDVFRKLLLAELRDRFVTVEDGFGELEGEVNSVDKIEFISIDEFQTQENEILATGRVSVTASVSYSGPDMSTATYDSEDKVAYAFRDISADGEFELELDITMTVSLDRNRIPDVIESVRVTGDDYVTLTTYENLK